MKRLYELTNEEACDLIIKLSAELKILLDDELKSMLKEYADARKGKESDLTIVDIIQQLINFALVKNRDAFFRILAAILQCTEERARTYNNLETIEALIVFFSIEQYRSLFQSVIKSATKK